MQHRKRPPSDTFVMGWHPVLEALETGKEFQRVMIQRDEKGERTGALMQKLHELNIPVQRVPKEKLLRITAKNHQGIIAFLSPITYQPLEELIARTFESGETPLLVAVDGVTDVRNIGAIARSAECFGATALVIPMSGVAPIQEDAIKSSSGALMRLPVARVPDMANAIKMMAQHGIQPVALSEKADDSIHESKIEGSICLVVGDEERGISNAVFRNCSEGVRLPMVGDTGSLNVSVAAGIALSHIAMWKDREDVL
ncbi:23S rRNA (guanosine(2251)-2'-O)-methyltransferase RlmB [Flavobacteriales bacterium]|nr:23S rRNA (guanosine(2251)-2'-O)-methyltransferase RlmB [Flavobacteriales bacterium]